MYILRALQDSIISKNKSIISRSLERILVLFQALYSEMSLKPNEPKTSAYRRLTKTRHASIMQE